MFVSFLLVSLSIHPHVLTLTQLVVLGASVIACRSIQRHIVALKSDIDIYKFVLLPMREREQEHTSQHLAPQQGSVFAPPPRKMAKRAILICCVRKFVIGFELVLFHSCLIGLKLLALSNVILFLSCMFRAQFQSPICVFTADMFSMPFITFEILCYAAEFANLLAEVPSPPPSCIRPFNKLVYDSRDIEAEEGEDSDRHGSPNC